MNDVTLTHTAAITRFGNALSHETRTRIMLALREAPAYPSDLADALEVSRQVMSNQLACLRGCGLVEAVPDGRRTWYRLADPHLAPALEDRKSTRLNSSHVANSYDAFCLKKKIQQAKYIQT